MNACLPVVEIATNYMKLCTGLLVTSTSCSTYTAATYAAAQVRWLLPRHACLSCLWGQATSWPCLVCLPHAIIHVWAHCRLRLQAATKFADNSKASIAASLCLKLGKCCCPIKGGPACLPAGPAAT